LPYTRKRSYSTSHTTANNDKLALIVYTDRQLSLIVYSNPQLALIVYINRQLALILYTEPSKNKTSLIVYTEPSKNLSVIIYPQRATNDQLALLKLYNIKKRKYG
jgi:hypothetical protein